ncbi:hypothetical protein V1227_30185 [Lentzea sp. DG1S-22]|uniref:hypothetical protein n=1 Tax=Lentzea sp. DG1S-22 TaxID=3108822 RepID=UPI002E76C26B|nr:hypothetical protein [Lentzea sp. DG1S-22]WVH79276.1 hypothetical protein V1227_30185 [Lentzea sp. DG1S-22]
MGKSVLLLLPLLAALSGCGVLEGFDPELNAVGKQVVSDWKQRPETAAAQFEYTHGLDADDRLVLQVMLEADRISDQVVDEFVQIARRDCWRGTWKSCSARYVVYSTDDPPYGDRRDSGKPVREGDVDLPPDLELVFGPRPERPKS